MKKTNIIRVLEALLLLPIRLYQYIISPLLGPCCRYAPSCSEYAALALKTHGPLRGGNMALKRILRCHPWGGHGYDPVPSLKECSQSATQCSHHHTTGNYAAR